MSKATAKQKDGKKVVIDESKVFRVNQSTVEPIRDQSN